MSIFKESEWETDDTGDKLAKELFVSKKKIKPVSDEQSRKKFKEKGRKKKSGISRSDDNSGGADHPAARNNTDNKKRKSSSIEIDESIIKKWKSESISQARPNGGIKSSKKESSKKRPKLSDRERKTEDNAAPVTKKTSKKKNPESEEETNSDNKKKLNKALPETVSSSVNNPMTKSQKRRLKQKEKLLKKVGENGENNSIESDIIEGKMRSSDAQVSKKTNGSKLKIDRLERMLIAKQQSSLRNGGISSEPQSLRDRMMARLKSSRFRYLNEQMYNSESWSSKKYFKEDPDAFFAYHEGYKLQVDQWPLNPLDSIIASVKRLPKDYIVADFGCGEARLAESVPQKVHSLDLVAVNDRVTACDMAHTSLLTGRIDVVVFCLSLMGTNLTDYIIEANRVLRKDGILKIAEVESRFEDVDEFVKNLGRYGFGNTWKDLSHNLFYFMDFKKEGDITKKRNKLPPLALKSCLYKRR